MTGRVSTRLADRACAARGELEAVVSGSIQSTSRRSVKLVATSARARAGVGRFANFEPRPAQAERDHSRMGRSVLDYQNLFG
jgi:hypothetical protein